MITSATLFSHEQVEKRSVSAELLQTACFHTGWDLHLLYIVFTGSSNTGAPRPLILACDFWTIKRQSLSRIQNIIKV